MDKKYKYEWENIDDNLFTEAGAGEMVTVSKEKEYLDEMEAQNKKVVAVLSAKYPERTFKVGKWNMHEFGAYQEVLEKIAYEVYEDEDENYW